MNHEERKRIVAEWVSPDGGLFSRYKPPSLSPEAARAELVEIVEAVAEKAPLYPAPDAFREFLSRVGREVNASARTRSWPMLSEILAGIKAARERGAPASLVAGGGDGGSFEEKVRHASDWWAKFGDIPSWWNTEEIARALLDRGVATYGELRQAGAALPARKPHEGGAALDDLAEAFPSNRP